MLVRLARGKGSKKEKVKRAITGLVKSCLFAANMSMGVTMATCDLWGLLNNGVVTPNIVFYMSFVWGSFFLFESHQRWGEMSIWVLANWLEGYKYSLEKRGMMPDIPFLHVRIPVS